MSVSVSVFSTATENTDTPPRASSTSPPPLLLLLQYQIWRECRAPLEELTVEGYSGSLKCPYEWDSLCSQPDALVRAHADVLVPPSADPGVVAVEEAADTADTYLWKTGSPDSCNMPEWENLFHLNSTKAPAGLLVGELCISLPVMGGGLAFVSLVLTAWCCFSCTRRCRRKTRVAGRQGYPADQMAGSWGERNPAAISLPYSASRLDLPPASVPPRPPANAASQVRGVVVEGGRPGVVSPASSVEQWRQQRANLAPVVTRIPGSEDVRRGDDDVALAIALSLSESGAARQRPRVPDADELQVEAAIAASLASSGISAQPAGARVTHNNATPVRPSPRDDVRETTAIELSIREHERARHLELEEDELLKAAMHASLEQGPSEKHVIRGGQKGEDESVARQKTEHWYRYWDESQSAYYFYNPVTKETSWVLPSGASVEDPASVLEAEGRLRDRAPLQPMTRCDGGGASGQEAAGNTSSAQTVVDVESSHGGEAPHGRGGREQPGGCHSAAGGDRGAEERELEGAAVVSSARPEAVWLPGSLASEPRGSIAAAETGPVREAATCCGEAGHEGQEKEGDWATDADGVNDISSSRHRWGYEGTGDLVDVDAIRQQVKQANTTDQRGDKNSRHEY